MEKQTKSENRKMINDLLKDKCFLGKLMNEPSVLMKG